MDMGVYGDTEAIVAFVYACHYDRWMCVWRGMHAFRSFNFGFRVAFDEDIVNGRVSILKLGEPTFQRARFFNSRATIVPFPVALRMIITTLLIPYIYRLSNDNMQLGQSDRSSKVTSAYRRSKYIVV